jgi:hypothetical protein
MIQTLLAKLEGVRESGRNKWVARCPAHADKRPSLVLKEADDGKALMHCFAGCAVDDIVSAVGLSLADLFPQTEGFAHGKRQRPERTINAADGLRLLEYEVGVLQVCANDMLRCLDTGERLHASTPEAITKAAMAIRHIAHEALR